MFAPIVFLCVLSANIGLSREKYHYKYIFHNATFLLSAMLIFWSGEWIESTVSVALAYLSSFVIIYSIFSPFRDELKSVDLVLHLVLTPLTVFFLFPLHIPETDFPLGRVLTLIVIGGLLTIHFIIHRSCAEEQKALYVFWIAVHAVTLLLF